MDKKYQVFVSSTYLDLKDERQEAMYALLELDCIPSGMELFPAANEDQWSIIQRVIDECDYFIVIIAGRYGSLGREGKSFTQMEYEYAVLQRKPVVAFLHRDPSGLPASKREENKEREKLLVAFRELAQKRMCRYWTSPDRLKADVITSLVRLIEDNPSGGWIRGDSRGIFYDEVAELQRTLRKQKIFGRTTLLGIVQSIVNENGEEVWRRWSSGDFMQAVDQAYDNALQDLNSVTEEAPQITQMTQIRGSRSAAATRGIHNSFLGSARAALARDYFPASAPHFQQELNCPSFSSPHLHIQLSCWSTVLLSHSSTISFALSKSSSLDIQSSG